MSVVVIGLSMEHSVSQYIRSMVAACNGTHSNGVYIDAHDTSELAEAFSQVAVLISSGPNLNVETY